MTRALVVTAIAAVATAVAISAGGAQQAPTLAGPPAAITQYGYVRALASGGGAYRMRFDPAAWLSGETAQRAAVEDGVVAPGEPVPNDYYVRNESTRQLSYLVRRDARVTVVTNPAGGLRSTRITVSELAAIVRGGNPNRRTLYGRDLGFWARIAGDRVLALDQQYQP